jgi:flagellar biosynthesis GTPase FlhF
VAVKREIKLSVEKFIFLIMKRTSEAIRTDLDQEKWILEEKRLKSGIAAREARVKKLDLELFEALQAEAAEREARRPRVWFIVPKNEYSWGSRRVCAAYTTRELAEANLPKREWHRENYTIEEHVLDNATEKDYVPPPSP